ncbi:MAG: Rho termination factor N-terminal domain-containing protein [Actinomycetota bacterium]
MNVDDLRQHAKDAGIDATSSMRKDELLDALLRSAHSEEGGASGEGAGSADRDADDGAAVGAGPDGGKVRTGPESSDSLKYSQEVTSADDEPERQGRSLVTTHHEVIKQWAEARDATPATVSGTEHDEHLGVLRFDFGGDSDNLQHVSWDAWFKTFDERQLNFIYQEERSDGQQSNFFRLENPGREDA